MTVGEVVRAVESNNRVIKLQHKERATFDYIQANLIAQGFCMAFGAKGNYPTLYEAYSSVFQEEKEAEETELQEKRDTLSMLRFKQFAQYHNSK